MSLSADEKALLERLRAVLDTPKRRYRELSGARDLGEYLAGARRREDEELLTEPITRNVIERVLGFPPDAYFEQLGRSGLKPDFTPMDLVAHSFVLDAKASTQQLAAHEPQIRAYIDQRQLDRGVLFNLDEVRVYDRGSQGHNAALSFHLLPLWQVARGEALPDANVSRFLEFCSRFRYRELDIAERIELIREAKSWRERAERGDTVVLDIDFLIGQLRRLSSVLADDAAAQHDELAKHVSLSPGRERELHGELQALAQDLSPGIDLAELPDRVGDFRDAGGVAERVWHQYLLRVAQLALTRIVLYRSWEDVGFVEEHLYDGGFGQVYDRLGQSIRAVLDEAFIRGQAQYRWLYGSDNNYDWYRPRDEALADVLYSLMPVPLGELDADVLGGLYESYVDEIDRDRLGQFFTPRAVVGFMLDRAGFEGSEGVFKLEGNRREPLRIFDFATGSGGFLVEAARRIVDQGGISADDANGLNESLAAIVRGFHGCEISPFPYYLTEINLLLQVSRLLGRLRLVDERPGSFALRVLHADTLTTRRARDESIEGLEADDRLDRGELAEDQRFGLVPLDAEKREAFRQLREDGAFDLVVGNPPYVFETNNRILFERLRSLPAWTGIYRGKSDYLYYFLYLAAEKLAPEGRLCVITPAGWMNAGNAAWLREELAGSLRLDQLFLFGSHRLFAPEHEQGVQYRPPTPTVESAILLATKTTAPKPHKLRIVALEDEAKAAAALSGDPDARVPDREALLAEMALRASGRGGRSRGIHVHDVRQDKLVSDRPWPIKHGARDVAARVVAHLQQSLDSPDSAVERLAESWVQTRGIETAADAYTARIQKRLPADVKARLAAAGAETGDPIMELPPGREQEAPWREHPELLARGPESRAILYGALDEDDYTSLAWLGRGDEAPDAVVAELEPWREVLATRAEIKRNPRRQWWEAAWPRDKAKLRAPKVIALYRTDRGRFALDEGGDWQPSNKTTIVTAKRDGLSVAYLCGLLNSELLDLWYAVRGKSPRDVWRNYEPKPMAEIPYRRVEPAHGGGASPMTDSLHVAVEAGDWDGAAIAAGELGDALRGDDALAPQAQRALEEIVRAIAGNRSELLPQRAFAPELDRIVKDPWKTSEPAIDAAATIEQLPAPDKLSVRIDAELSVSVETDGALGKSEVEGGERLTFTRARKRTATVEGPGARLLLLERLVAGKRVLPDDLLSTLLPRDLEAFDEAMRQRAEAIAEQLRAGRVLVEAAERLVCRLYGLPGELEDAVVEHAVRRAQGES